MARALVVGTSLAGHGGAPTAVAVARSLALAHWDAEVEIATDQASLARLAGEGVRAGVDVVVAIGGDGTVLQVATALIGTDVALGIIPTGTGNLLAGNLDLLRPPLYAVGAVTRGRRRTIDLGRVSRADGTSHFAVACGIGFDARVMAATPSGLKRRLGKLAYLLTAAALSGSMRDEPQEVVVDGSRHVSDAAQVFVANFGALSAHVRPSWPVDPDDGYLDVFIVRASGPLAGLLAAWEALGPQRRGTVERRVSHLRGQEVSVLSRRSQPVEVDGDVIGSTPVRIRVIPAALSVMVPVT